MKQSTNAATPVTAQGGWLKPYMMITEGEENLLELDEEQESSKNPTYQMEPRLPETLLSEPTSHRVSNFK